MIQKKDYNKTLYFAKRNLSYSDLVLNVPGSAQPLPTVETNPRVENIESDMEIEITKVETSPHVENIESDLEIEIIKAEKNPRVENIESDLEIEIIKAETSPRVENTELDLEIKVTKVVPGNLFQEDRFVKTEQQSENSDNEVNVSQDISTSYLKEVIANETQVKTTHGASLSTDSDHNSDDRCNINHVLVVTNRAT